MSIMALVPKLCNPIIVRVRKPTYPTGFDFPLGSLRSETRVEKIFCAPKFIKDMDGRSPLSFIELKEVHDMN